MRPATGGGVSFGGSPFRPGSAGTNVPGMAARPAITARPAVGGGRPASLPGLGGVGTGRPLPGTRENIHANRADRVSNLKGEIGDRRGLQNVSRKDWQNWRTDHPEQWQNWRDQSRNNLQNWYSDRAAHYGNWYHGGWNGQGHSWWDHMWEDHTAAMILGTTFWARNRLWGAFGYGWGWSGYGFYDNPYCDEPIMLADGQQINYDDPLVEPPVDDAYDAGLADGQGDPGTLAVPPASPGMAEFDAARNAFFAGDYELALTQISLSLKALPNDAVVHEFRSLILFAQEKYREAAAGIYAVLAVGPGWDWTTLSGLYPNVEVYTAQLRALEKWMKENVKQPEVHFLLAYHYLCGAHSEAALRQFRQTLELTPNDPVVQQYVTLLSGEPAAADAPTPNPPEAGISPETQPAIAASQLVGDWRANGPKQESFELSLTAENAFTWTFTRGSTRQTVKGVWAIDGGVLALEPDTGGVMMANVTVPADGKFEFKALGGPADDPGLKFSK